MGCTTRKFLPYLRVSLAIYNPLSPLPKYPPDCCFLQDICQRRMVRQRSKHKSQPLIAKLYVSVLALLCLCLQSMACPSNLFPCHYCSFTSLHAAPLYVLKHSLFFSLVSLTSCVSVLKHLWRSPLCQLVRSFCISSLLLPAPSCSSPPCLSL